MSGNAASRRCRIQARPNVSSSLRVSKRTPSAPSKHDATNVGEHKVNVEGSAALEQSDKTNLGEHRDDDRNNASDHLSSEKAEKEQFETLSSPPQPTPPSPSLPTAIPTNSGCEINSSVESTPRCATTRRRHRSSVSTTSSRHRSPLKSPEVVHKTRKRFTGEEPLDPKRMTMQDMIWWNPKNDTALKNRDSGRKGNKEISAAEWEQNQGERRQKVEHEKAADKIAAPQVKIAEDGSLVLDESSLTVVEEPSRIWETVNEDRVERRVTSASFRKKAWRKGTPWSDLETDLFYDILRATGPDFGIMHEFFPSRTRAELKTKFNKEERTNWARLKKTMSSPTVLSDSLFTHANEALKKIGEELAKKKEQKMTKKEKKALQAAHQEQSGDEDVDSVANGTVRIKVVEAAARDSLVEKRSGERSHKKDSEKRSLQESDEVDIPEELGEDFPRFKIVEDPNATGVSLEQKDNGVPIVHMPLRTTYRAFPKDDSQPERILFDCPAVDERPAVQFLIQHRMGPNDPPSGFLHLFGPPQ
uniref:Myb-like domain-containing protein n=1 Tax=Parascaris univalens TaxID=6257 RepID=A0A915B7A9_PARUN